MNSFAHNLLKILVSQKKYAAITEYAKIEHPHKNETVIVSEYAGTDIRVLKCDDETINMICPKDMTTTQENAVVKAIENGTIFDDAGVVDNNTKYIELSVLPHNAIINKGKESPKKLRIAISSVIGKMNDDGRCVIDQTEIDNGCNFVKDVMNSAEKNTSIQNILDDYLNNDKYGSLTKSLRDDINKIEDEIESIKDISEDDAITDSDYELLDIGDDDDDKHFNEGFLTKRPKKLKPIPRDIISYITIELNAINDSNDQAMLSGYTCSKLELVDFYLNVIDTKDDRYIVPHNRDYLVSMQNELNRLLTQILRIKPINKNDRVWRVNVNYPEGWRG